jgi:SnoaL-like domain
MSTPEENIKTILADWLDALRRHDLATVERRMDPDVFWQGVREDFVCHNRDEAMEMLREQQQREEHGVEALELIATEEKVVLGVRSTQLQEIGGVPLGGQIFQVFTLRDHDGRIVRVEEYRRRREALEAAGAEDRAHWL